MRFQHLSDPKRYEQVLEEVSGYYPTRLRRIRRLFADGLRRLRSSSRRGPATASSSARAYLFGARVTRGVWEPPGLDGSTRACTPRAAPSRATSRPGRSFAESEFRPQAIAALESAMRLARAEKGERRAGRKKSPASDAVAEARRPSRGAPPPMTLDPLSPPAHRRRRRRRGPLPRGRGPVARSIATPTTSSPLVHLVSFGCQMNELDAELVLGDLARKGFRRTDAPDVADLILVNTCSVARARRGQGLEPARQATGRSRRRSPRSRSG